MRRRERQGGLRGLWLLLLLGVLLLGGGAAEASERFERLGDCLRDTQTGHVWARAPEPALWTWSEAAQRVQGFTLCGYRDWRLPTWWELWGLVPEAWWGEEVEWLEAQGFDLWRQEEGYMRRGFSVGWQGVSSMFWTGSPATAWTWELIERVFQRRPHEALQTAEEFAQWVQQSRRNEREEVLAVAFTQRVPGGGGHWKVLPVGKGLRLYLWPVRGGVVGGGYFRSVRRLPRSAPIELMRVARIR